MRLAGKIAIVTGAASGFGEGIARKFVAEGAKVIVADRDGDGARAGRRRARRRPPSACAPMSPGPPTSRRWSRRRSSASAASTSWSTTPAWATCRSRSRSSAEDDFDRILERQRQGDLPRREGGRAALQGAEARRHPQHRQHRRRQPAAAPELVQRQQGLGHHRDARDGGRAGAVRHPRRRPEPGGRRDADAQDLHGRGHARDARQVPRRPSRSAASRPPRTWATPPASSAATRPR